MADVPPGWHPDPTDPQSRVRWWDGSSWTDHTQPTGSVPPAMPVVPQRVLLAGPTSGFYQQNRSTVTALGVVALYLVLAAATHIVLLGIFPASLAYRAVRRREPFAFVAVIAAIVGVVLTVGALMR
jgi:Protein of unknown function (DUF2510)